MSGVSYGLHIRVLGSKNEKVGLISLVLRFCATRLRYGRFRSDLKLTKTSNTIEQRQGFLPAVVRCINRYSIHFSTLFHHSLHQLFE